MLDYKMKIAGIEHSLPLCKITDDLYIGAFIMFGSAELTERCAAELLKIAPDFDYIVTAESKGIPLAHEMSRQCGYKKYFVARKHPKLYMTGFFEVDVKSITTDALQHLYLDVAEAEQIKGKKILIVDDVISTGESVNAVEKLVNQAGGIIVDKLAVLAEGDSQNRKDIKYLEKLPVFNADGTIKE